jgi:hypothetical protein
MYATILSEMGKSPLNSIEKPIRPTKKQQREEERAITPDTTKTDMDRICPKGDPGCENRMKETLLCCGASAHYIRGICTTKKGKRLSNRKINTIIGNRKTNIDEGPHSLINSEMGKVITALEVRVHQESKLTTQLDRVMATIDLAVIASSFLDIQQYMTRLPKSPRYSPFYDMLMAGFLQEVNKPSQGNDKITDSTGIDLDRTCPKGDLGCEITLEGVLLCCGASAYYIRGLFSSRRSDRVSKQKINTIIQDRTTNIDNGPHSQINPQIDTILDNMETKVRHEEGTTPQLNRVMAIIDFGMLVSRLLDIQEYLDNMRKSPEYDPFYEILKGYIRSTQSKNNEAPETEPREEPEQEEQSKDEGETNEAEEENWKESTATGN